MELFLKNWHNKFMDELSVTENLKIISPFVHEHVIRKILNRVDHKNFELITRYNLQDFALKVSSLKGLKSIVQSGSKVYGIKGLHSKVYLFDHRSALVTSANLTRGGVMSNYECGILLTDKKIINDLHNYFIQLKVIGKNPLTIEQCEDWELELSRQEYSRGQSISLPDFGASEVIMEHEINYYIKFFGTSHNRVSLDFKVKEEIDRALCHYACGFPENKKPRQVNDGDIVFMARMTENPNDYAIFGRAIACKYKEGRDRASAQEMSERDWKKKWPIYLRIKHAIFINATLSDCIFLSELMTKFEHNSFPSTRDRYDNGEIDIKPTKSLMRKAYIKLTPESALWLEHEFQESLKTFGRVRDSFIKKLPQSTTVI